MRPLVPSNGRRWRRTLVYSSGQAQGGEAPSGPRRRPGAGAWTAWSWAARGPRSGWKARGHAEVLPAGGRYRCPEAGGLDEGLGEQHGVAVGPLPVGAEAAQREREDPQALGRAGSRQKRRH